MSIRKGEGVRKLGNPMSHTFLDCVRNYLSGSKMNKLGLSCAKLIR